MIRHPIEELLRTLAAPGALPKAGAAATPAPPRSVSVVHYGPDGASVATTGKASYAPLNGGGLAVSYDAALAGGVPASSSSVTIDGQGRAQGASTRILAADGSPTRTITGSFGGLTLTAAGTPQAGSVALAVADPQGRQTHAATMTYAAETCESYGLTALDAKGAVQGRTEISYAGAAMAGTRLIGGSLAVSRSDGSGTPLSQAQSNLTRDGVPSTVLGTNFEPDGKTPRQRVLSDYAGVAFGPLRTVQSGSLLVTTQTPAGAPTTRTVFTYQAGQLVTTAPLKPGQVIPAITPAVQAAVPGPWVPPRPADRSAQVTRSDGSLIETREDWFVSPGTTGTPRRSILTLYATDGKTVIRITDIDYSGATFDGAGNPAGGTVVSTQFQAGTRASITHVSY